eukprot:CAMPEP_0185614826 /NCGR_PEP_ID=MMETSP0436-20130131/33457_1 /TAXON_ID=626734 ORGANISM="Favella taraikaensis, Strain Fe Narragansett Bay" /NCGR_SAMPLE_ID=MMETSP0436 /ASSEMBLY_ACC=CAM_ASM_000390 /LENGTH=49 /DNA_ID= /DNA_START= /DNA_END= /DNA_ORIENTATION=
MAPPLSFMATVVVTPATFIAISAMLLKIAGDLDDAIIDLEKMNDGLAIT